jgi:hypothetical protein
MDGSGVLAVNESRDASAQGPGDLKLALQTESKLVDSPHRILAMQHLREIGAWVLKDPIVVRFGVLEKMRRASDKKQKVDKAFRLLRLVATQN